MDVLPGRQVSVMDIGNLCNGKESKDERLISNKRLQGRVLSRRLPFHESFGGESIISWQVLLEKQPVDSLWQCIADNRARASKFSCDSVPVLFLAIDPSGGEIRAPRIESCGMPACCFGEVELLMSVRRRSQWQNGKSYRKCIVSRDAEVTKARAIGKPVLPHWVTDRCNASLSHNLNCGNSDNKGYIRAITATIIWEMPIRLSHSPIPLGGSQHEHF